MMQRLARFCYRRRWRVLGAWVVLLVGLFALNSSFGGKFLDEFDLPGSESQEAVDLLEEHGYEDRAGATGQIVFKADDVNDPTVRRDMEALFDEVGQITAPSQVVSPYSPEGAHQISQSGPEAGRIAYAEVNLADRDSDELYDIGTEAREAVADADISGVEVELGGDIAFEQPEFSSEAIGFVAALIILLIAFGSLLAAGLPLITAIFGIVTGIAIVGLVVNVIGMPSFSNQAVAMIGIGVGIDYALFIV
ncbi:MAG: MMPL family transporter, partial [Candidatus Limnocylindrales bacterium]